jgi:3-methylcrotonyl-CoA carboxylase beta subunit
MSEDERAEFMRPTIEKYEEEGSAYYSTARLWDDGIIDPADTRRVPALAIAASIDAAFPQRKVREFRM